MKVIAQNKKAFFDYEFFETIEAGIVLTGDEVKALREYGVTLTGAFVTVHGGELYLINCYIKQYGRAYTKDETQTSRRRKLLIHKRQLDHLIGLTAQKGVAMLPVKMYFSDKNKLKVAVGIGRHKKMTDKKQIIKERDLAREARRDIKTE
jgi:SsrA-binding protein